jgi:hypothetical protein
MRKAMKILLIILTIVPSTSFAQADSADYYSDSNKDEWIEKINFEIEYNFFKTNRLKESSMIGMDYNFVLYKGWGISINSTFNNFNNVKNMPSDYEQHKEPLGSLLSHEFGDSPNDFMALYSFNLIKEFPISHSVSYGFGIGFSSISYTETKFNTYYYSGSTDYYYDYYKSQITAMGLSLLANIEVQINGFLGFGLNLKANRNDIYSYFSTDFHLTFWFFNRERRNRKERENH